jgi:L-amino acid N-acyltransferase YncA
MQVRDATDSDLAGILEIYNDIIRTSTAVYSVEPVTIEERRAWLEARRDRGFPVLVAVDATDGTQVLGFASFGDWRGNWVGYRYTVEHTVHVRADVRRRGVGRELVDALIPRARELGKHAMIGGIDAANLDSLLFHKRLGFERVAHFREVGRKFGRWLDLVFMQRWLDAPGAQRPD